MCTRVPASDQPLSVGAVTSEGSNGAVPRNDPAPERERERERNRIRRKEARGGSGETDWEREGGKNETIDEKGKREREGRRKMIKSVRSGN